MKRSSKNNAVVFIVLLACTVISMASLGSLLVEARIPHFSAIQGSLKNGLHRRSLKSLPPAVMNSPNPNARYS
ncbi:hypothetical protein CRYUN_Cryun01aG0134100 [Craigia yunnanensis]